MALRSGTRGLWHPNGCRLRAGNNGSIAAHSSSGIRQLSSSSTNPMAGTSRQKTVSVKLAHPYGHETGHSGQEHAPVGVEASVRKECPRIAASRPLTRVDAVAGRLCPYWNVL